MTRDGNEGAAFIVVSAERGEQALPEVLDALGRRGIAVEAVAHGRQLRRTPAIVLRVQSARAAEALLALELEGFADVLAYSLEDG